MPEPSTPGSPICREHKKAFLAGDLNAPFTLFDDNSDAETLKFAQASAAG